MDRAAVAALIYWLGSALVVIGAELISIPYGFIAAGVAIVLFVETNAR